MSFPPKTQVESIDSSGSAAGSGPSPQGPPPASPAPRKASSDTSLYSSAGKSATTQGNSGMGTEGSNPSIIGVQGLALIQRGIQMLSLAFPENPGLTAMLADITSRLQTMIPQLVSQATNQNVGGMPMGGGMGMMGPAMQSAMQPPGPPGLPPPPQQPMPGQAGPIGPPVPPH